MKESSRFLDMTEYPESFYHKVFDLFQEYFNVPEAYRNSFVEEYHTNSDDQAYDIPLICSLISRNEIVSVYFVVPDPRYLPHKYPYLEYGMYDSCKVVEEFQPCFNTVEEVNEKIKALSIRCMKCAVFL